MTRNDAKRVLVTGGTGFVGRAIVNALVEAGHDVLVLSRRSRPEHLNSRVEHRQQDLTTLTVDSSASLLDEFNIDVVVHSAGELSDTSRMRSLHLDATSVLTQAAAGRIEQWIQISSVGALGGGFVGEASPDQPGEPKGEYEVTKAKSDAIVKQAFHASGTVATILMPTIVFGPDMPNRSLFRLAKAVSAGHFAYVGPSTAGAHYVHVQDLAWAVVKALQARSGGAFIISDSTTIQELVTTIAVQVGTKPPKRRIPESIISKAVSPRLNWAPLPGRGALRALRSQTTYSHWNATSEIGWVPRIGWRQGLENCLTHWHMTPRTKSKPGALKVVYVTTIADTLNFFKGHIAHEQRQGSDITLISDASDGQLDRLGSEVGVKTVSLSLTRRITPWGDAKALFNLVRTLHLLQPDVLQTATPKAGLVGALAGRIAGVPVIVAGVFGLPQMTSSGWRKRLLNATTRITTYASHASWVDSPSMADYLSETRLAPKNKIIVIGKGSVSGIDTIHFSPKAYADARISIRRELGIPASALVLGFVGRLANDKGILELATAWETIRAQHPEAHLLLVGPDEGDLKGPAQELLSSPPPRTHWVGPQSPVARWFAALDIFVMPSYREGFCVTNIEAAAMELPVVATRIPGCVDSVAEDVTGTLVPSHDAQALQSAIENYMRNRQLAQAHALAGRRRVIEQFQPSTLENELATFYRSKLRKESRNVREKTF